MVRLPVFHPGTQFRLHHVDFTEDSVVAGRAPLGIKIRYIRLQPPCHYGRAQALHELLVIIQIVYGIEPRAEDFTGFIQMP